MRKFFDEWSNDIINYCLENDLDFERLKKLSQCCGDNFLALQYHDERKQIKGLLDETTMPPVLLIENKNNNLVFTQTEYTKKYL